MEEGLRFSRVSKSGLGIVIHEHSCTETHVFKSLGLKTEAAGHKS